MSKEMNTEAADEIAPELKKLIKKFNSLAVIKALKSGEELHKVKANFWDVEGVRVYVEVEGKVNVTIERLGRKISLMPSKDGDGNYEVSKRGMMSVGSIYGMLHSVNEQVENNGLNFKLAAGGKSSIHANGTSQTAYNYSLINARTDPEGVKQLAVIDARDALELPPELDID